MFGNDSAMNNLNSQEKSKIDELFSHDQNVATQYQQNPQLSTSPSGRVLDPYARELALSNRYKGTAGDLTSIRQGQQTRRDVIGDSLANALKLAQAALDHKKYELEQLQKDREFAWEVYKEKHKSTGGGGQATTQALFDSIMGLQGKVKAATPAQESYTTNRTIGKGLSKQQLVSDLQKKFGTKNLSLTYNKNGTITATPLKPKQGYMETSEANALDASGGFEGMVNKLSGAAIAGGASTSDVASILQLLGTGTSTKAPTRGQQQDSAIQELTTDLASVPQGMKANDLYVKLKSAYPEVPDTTIKNLMRASGYAIY